MVPSDPQFSSFPGLHAQPEHGALPGEASHWWRSFARPQRVYSCEHPRGGVNAPDLPLRDYADCRGPMAARFALAACATRALRAARYRSATAHPPTSWPLAPLPGLSTRRDHCARTSLPPEAYRCGSPGLHLLPGWVSTFVSSLPDQRSWPVSLRPARCP